METLLQKDDFLKRLSDFLACHVSEDWCVASVDVGHFKLYNEWYGQEKGDALLRAIGDCLGRYQRAYGCPVGYFGNDDFFLCLPDNESVLHTVHADLQACLEPSMSNVSFFVAMGVCAVKDAPQGDCNALCNYAQIAAAHHGEVSDSLQRFTPERLRRLKRRQLLLTELERALQKEEFCFYLQPKCNSMTGDIVSMEALVRWKHPVWGMISPGEFIPLLEQMGLISQLDCWLWEAVCQMLARWKREGRNLVPVSINVSVADIAGMDVAQKLAELVTKYRLETRLLIVEITESVLAQNLSNVENVIRALHEKGISVVMDDFGSGYSSLNVLKNISVDGIKLDVQLIDLNAGDRTKAHRILESAILLAHKLEMPIVAEGVETQEQVCVLQSLDCLYAQGYYFYRPMPVAEAEALLESPQVNSYWDVWRDMLRRDHTVFTGGTVSEQNAVALQAFQIISDYALEVARLNLATGEYRVVKRDERLPELVQQDERNFDAYCAQMISGGIICPDDAGDFRASTRLEQLREKMFRKKEPRFCHVRLRLEEQFVWCTVEIIPCSGCAEKSPWAVVITTEDASPQAG